MAYTFYEPDAGNVWFFVVCWYGLRPLGRTTTSDYLLLVKQALADRPAKMHNVQPSQATILWIDLGTQVEGGYVYLC